MKLAASSEPKRNAFQLCEPACAAAGVEAFAQPDAAEAPQVEHGGRGEQREQRGRTQRGRRHAAPGAASPERGATAAAPRRVGPSPGPAASGRRTATRRRVGQRHECRSGPTVVIGSSSVGAPASARSGRRVAVARGSRKTHARKSDEAQRRVATRLARDEHGELERAAGVRRRARAAGRATPLVRAEAEREHDEPLHLVPHRVRRARGRRR